MKAITCIEYHKLKEKEGYNMKKELKVIGVVEEDRSLEGVCMAHASIQEIEEALALCDDCNSVGSMYCVHGNDNKDVYKY